MTDPKRTCGNCDYFTAGANGHGTCHVAAPGSIARNGFPIIAAGDWCAKGATGGVGWLSPDAKDAAIATLTRALDRAFQNMGEQTLTIGRLLARSLWQRICNTVPWEGK